MGPQQPTEDEVLLARAEANGYRRGVHRESDEVRGREKHVTKVKKNQDGTLRRYILYVRGAVDRDLRYWFQHADTATTDGISGRRRKRLP